MWRSQFRRHEAKIDDTLVLLPLQRRFVTHRPDCIYRIVSASHVSQHLAMTVSSDHNEYSSHATGTPKRKMPANPTDSKSSIDAGPNYDHLWSHLRLCRGCSETLD